LFYAGYRTEVGHFMLNAKFHDGNDDYIARRSGWHVVTPRRGDVDELPPNVVQALVARLIPNEVSRNFDFSPFGPRGRIPYMVTDCDIATGRNVHNYPEAGTIVYDPEDYLEPINSTECRFKVGSGLHSGRGFLSTIATHYHRDKTGFCDPR
jgi:hypothetical protein